MKRLSALLLLTLAAGCATAPVVVPRWACIRWLEDASLALFDAVVSVRMALDPYFEPSFPLLVTGKLPAPKVIGRKEEP